MAEVGLDQLDDLVVVTVGHQQPRGQRAALAGVGDHRERREHRGHVEVGVVEDDHRGLAAQFQEDPLEGAAGGSHDGAAGRGGPGEGDHVDAGVGEHRADLGSDELSTLTTPGGMSVCSAISSPRASVIRGPGRP